LDSTARPRYGGAMRYPRTGTLGLAAALLALLAALGCRQPQPTYEYGETETTITTTPPPGRAVVTTSTLAAAPKEPAWKRGDGR
jgi:hypothetical protein